MTKQEKEAYIKKWTAYIDNYQKTTGKQLPSFAKAKAEEEALAKKEGREPVEDEKIVEKVVTAAVEDHERLVKIMELNKEKEAREGRMKSKRLPEVKGEKSLTPMQSRMINYYFDEHDDAYNEALAEFLASAEGRELYTASIMKRGMDGYNVDVMLDYDNPARMAKYYGTTEQYNNMFLFGTDLTGEFVPELAQKFVTCNKLGFQSGADCFALTERRATNLDASVMFSLGIETEEFPEFQDSIVKMGKDEKEKIALKAESDFLNHGFAMLVPLNQTKVRAQILEGLGKNAREEFEKFFDLSNKVVLVEDVKKTDEKTGKEKVETVETEISKAALMTKIENGEKLKYKFVDNMEQLAAFQTYLKRADIFANVTDAIKKHAGAINEAAERCTESATLIQIAREEMMDSGNKWYRGSSKEYKSIERKLEALREKLAKTDMQKANSNELDDLKTQYSELIKETEKYINDRRDRENAEPGYQKTRYDNVKTVKDLLNNEMGKLDSLRNKKIKVEDAILNGKKELRNVKLEESVGLFRDAMEKIRKQTEKMADVLKKSDPKAAKEMEQVADRLADPKEEKKVMEALAKSELGKEVQKNPDIVKDVKEFNKRVMKEITKFAKDSGDVRSNAPALEKVEQKHRMSVASQNPMQL